MVTDSLLWKVLYWININKVGVWSLSCPWGNIWAVSQLTPPPHAIHYWSNSETWLPNVPHFPASQGAAMANGYTPGRNLLERKCSMVRSNQVEVIIRPRISVSDKGLKHFLHSQRWWSTFPLPHQKEKTSLSMKGKTQGDIRPQQAWLPTAPKSMCGSDFFTTTKTSTPKPPTRITANRITRTGKDFPTPQPFEKEQNRCWKLKRKTATVGWKLCLEAACLQKQRDGRISEGFVLIFKVHQV